MMIAIFVVFIGAIIIFAAPFIGTIIVAIFFLFIVAILIYGIFLVIEDERKN